MSEKRAEYRVSTASEAQRLAHRIGEAAPIRNNVKAAINHVARRLHWKFSRAKDVWYGDHRIRLSVDEFNALRQAAGEIDAADPEIIALRKMVLELRDRIEKINSQMGDPPAQAVRKFPYCFGRPVHTGS